MRVNSAPVAWPTRTLYAGRGAQARAARRSSRWIEGGASRACISNVEMDDQNADRWAMVSRVQGRMVYTRPRGLRQNAGKTIQQT